MVFKISGTVIRVSETLNMNRMIIHFVGGVRGGVNLNESCQLITTATPFLKEHISKAYIKGAVLDEKEIGINIATSNDILHVSKKVIMDAMPWLYAKKKGGTAKKTMDEQIQIALNNLAKKEMFVSINPKSNVLSDEAFKGTQIEIIFHE